MADEPNDNVQTQEGQDGLSEETKHLAAVGRGEAEPGKPAEGAEEGDKPQRPDSVPEKFWDAEKGELRTDALLKSYTELEKSRQKAADEEAKKKAEEAKGKKGEEGNEDGEPPANISAELFTTAQEEFSQSGALSDETREKIISGGIPAETLDTYLEGVKALSEALTQKVYGEAGGEDEYLAAVEWARDNWSEQKIAKFDAALADPDMMPVMVSALMNDFGTASPGEGKQTRQQGGGSDGDLYHDAEEFTRDLQKADNENDGLARKKAVQKLQRSKKAGTLKHVTPRSGTAKLFS